MLKKNRIVLKKIQKVSLLEDYDHVHTDKWLLDIDEAMVEDDLPDIALDHVPQRNTLDNDH